MRELQHESGRRKLIATRFGLPQRRTRIFFLGSNRNKPEGSLSALEHLNDALALLDSIEVAAAPLVQHPA